MNNLATIENFARLSQDFTYTYIQFRLKYFIHDNQDSPNYRKLPKMWNGFLVGLENSYILGLAKAILPLSRYTDGTQKFKNEIAIETWINGFSVKNKKAAEHLKDWRDKVLAHIDVGISGMHDRSYMTLLMNEALEAMAEISKMYQPNFDYKSELIKIAEQSESEFVRLLGLIKKM